MWITVTEENGNKFRVNMDNAISYHRCGTATWIQFNVNYIYPDDGGGDPYRLAVRETPSEITSLMDPNR